MTHAAKPPKAKRTRTFRLTAQQIADACTDYVRSEHFPEADIDGRVSFFALGGEVFASVAVRKVAPPARTKKRKARK